MQFTARTLAFVFLSAATVLTPIPAPGATITRNGDRIVLTGTIQPGDYTAFAAALDDGVRTVVLGSGGGRVDEAMSIGRLIRKRRLDTAIPSSCVSACALIWAGGARREAAGRLGMHCPTFPGQFQCYAPTRRLMIAYLKEMGAPSGMIEMQEAAGSTSSIYLTAAQLASPVADAGPEDDDQPPPPPPRKPPREIPPPVYYPPPPGMIFIPSEGRAMPCLPALLTLGMLRLCI